jgi:endonuclease YncB( thermonuclease family)
MEKRLMQIRTRLIALAALALPELAHADPCEGDLPRRAGESFAGTVRHIGDGDSLCVGQSRDPTTWIEVRLADFNAPELNARGGRDARAALERIAMGRQVRCVAGGGRSNRVVSYDRVIATCRINGRRIGDLLRDAGVEEGGR